ncbi:MAG: hypothetical protein KDB00_01615 [Planctomycetales bacterium]|nr:hypothetical protein [Planctomycetales bacterium]
MVSRDLLDRVADAVGKHVRASKGFEEESFVNPLMPVDCVAAFVMAEQLTREETFDFLVSVAPEGHVYGYFFEMLGNSVLSVHVDYPPRRCEMLDDLTVLEGRRVLILEDDVASGTTLRIVVDRLREFRPGSIDLYLGRPKESQVLEFIDPAINQVYLAEDHLRPNQQSERNQQFIDFFTRQLSD